MKELIHGLASTYNNDKCRCDECKTAWAEYQRPRVKKWREEKRKEKKKGVQVNL